MKHVCFLIILFATVVSHGLHAQSTNSQITIKALEFRSSRGSDGEDNFEYRLNTWYNDVRNTNCVGFSNQPKNTWLPVAASDQLRVSNRSLADINTQLDFETEGWEEDGCGGDCSYDYGCFKSDESHCGKSLPNIPIVPYNMIPGNYTGYPNLQTYGFCNNNYEVKYLVTYTPPAPQIPIVNLDGTTLTTGTGLICEDSIVNLTTSIYIKPEYLNHINYKWEYNINDETYVHYIPNPEYCGDDPICSGGELPQITNLAANSETKRSNNSIEKSASVEPGDLPPCCSVSPYILVTEALWRTVPGGMTKGDENNGLKSFVLRSLPGLTNITVNSKIIFRVTALANGLTSDFTAPSIVINISPRSPTATKIETLPSCPGNIGTGVVYVSGVTSQFSNYRYILKKGDVPALGCNPNIDGSCLFADDFSGIDTDEIIEIQNVKTGEYTLFLLNNAGTEGFCPRRIGVVTVGVVPDLTINPLTIQNLTCHNVNEGSISVSINGGRPSNVFYDLVNNTSGLNYSTSSNTANASVSINQLDPGSYRLTVSDGCTPDTIHYFDLTQPVKVRSTEFQKADATCADPGNGTAKITVARSVGALDLSVSTIFQYQIFKDGLLFREIESTDVTYTWTDLPVSTSYRMIVKEKGGLDCNAAIEDFRIDGPVALGISNLNVGSVSCFSGSDATISVNGTGGTGSYSYALYIILKDTTITNTTGSFSGLKAGGYTLSVKNAMTCNDRYIHPTITVQQPTPLQASLSKKDISCNGLMDGEVTSIVSGGTPAPIGYLYTWESYLNSSWVQKSNISESLTGQGEGSYRLRITDANLCPTLSNEVTIIEPEKIDIEQVIISDIKCLDEKGSIQVIGAGGTAPYTFAYSDNNGSTYTNFDATTLLGAGAYKVMITDKNNCAYQHPGNHLITTPPAALSFTEQLSDFNGFNISCFGGSNGSVLINASGGNGANYAGYEYALDNRTYQTSTNLQNIDAGTHAIKVKDARGCVVTKDILFSQTSAMLSAQLIEKQDVKCFGDLSGVIEVLANGGLAPYQYNVDGATFQDIGRFSQLGIGTYSITLKDKNECTSSVLHSIVSINPKIEIQTMVKDVSCFNGNDGAITTVISGGVSPFQYKWTETNGATSEIHDLVEGTYTLTVTDNVGCTMKEVTQVEQPQQPLHIKLTAVPVCYGRTNGSITALVSGGTAPYQYSSNNGQTYQPETLFIKGAGDYTITSKDNNGCLITANTSIVIRNVKPEPNFLVATTRNALDTLAIIDISIPKPDSIFWIFDPMAIVVKEDMWTPQLRFLEAGTYFASMTGYFGGCDYSVTKNMTVNPYDPNVEKEKNPGYKPIESVTVTPNPSTGEFDVTVKLNKKYKLTVVIFDIIGMQHYNYTWTDVEELSEHIVLPNAAAGVYVVRAITETDARDVRILIN